MFGEKVLNGKQVATALGISQGYLYKLLASGLPYHQLDEHSRKYYVLNEVEEWLLTAGFKQTTTWKN